jgi:CRISPR-associated protein Cmr6
MLPLPNRNVSARALSGPNGANAGLVWDKFADGWSFNGKGEYGLHAGQNGKGDWVGRFAKEDMKFGVPAELTRACSRIANVAAASLKENLPGMTDLPPPRNFTAVSRFVTGLGLTHPVDNGFLWHHTLGAPYLPGSSVKGMIRAWAEYWTDAGGDETDDTIPRLFGTDAVMGALIVFDALPVKPVQLVHEVLTPHDGGWRLNGPGVSNPPLSPGDWHDPNPVPFLAVDSGAEFQFALGVTRSAGADDLAAGYGLLEAALEWIGAGAKTATGFGRFRDASELEKEQMRIAEEAAAANAADAEKEQAKEQARIAAEAAGAAERERLRLETIAKAEQQAQQFALLRQAWVPKVGYVVRLIDDDEREPLLISALLPNGDFKTTNLQGKRETPASRDECELLAASLAMFQQR